MKISQKEITELKGQGILAQKQEGYFSFRVLSRAGNFTSQQLRDLADIAEKYGHGYLGETTRLAAEIPWIKYEDIDAVKAAITEAGMRHGGTGKKVEKYGHGYLGETTRLAAEIPWIKYEDIDAVKAAITEAGMRHGGTGKKVRPLVACKGTVCPHGLYDTQKLCGECHDAYFATPQHSKTKITFVGCPNNCAKANTNDIGLVGQAYVAYDPDQCINCGKCTKVCRAKALSLVDKKLVQHMEDCVNCGKCAQVCPVDAMTIKEQGLAVYLGGRMGRGYRFGDRLSTLYKEEDIPTVIDQILKTYAMTIKEQGLAVYLGGRMGRGYRFGDRLSTLYKEEDIPTVIDQILKTYGELGEDGERICHVIDRIGIEKFEDTLNEKLKSVLSK